jgi:hypothetical protein
MSALRTTSSTTTVPRGKDPLQGKLRIGHFTKSLATAERLSLFRFELAALKVIGPGLRELFSANSVAVEK